MIDLIRPNAFEAVGLVIALIILIAGGILIWRAHAHRRWPKSSKAHRHALEIRRQKNYESLPPGQL